MLLRQIAAGDQVAFKRVYGFYYKKLCLFAAALVKSREAAEEIVEDVFIRIWQQRVSVTSIRNLRVYLYTATKNTALNYLSRKASESITEPFDHIEIQLAGPSDPEQVMISAEMYGRIQRAVEALPPRCKMIFKLVREDNLRYKEISEILNISINTIDAQMAIAIKKIAASVESDLGFSVRKGSKPPFDQGAKKNF